MGSSAVKIPAIGEAVDESFFNAPRQSVPIGGIVDDSFFDDAPRLDNDNAAMLGKVNAVPIGGIVDDSFFDTPTADRTVVDLNSVPLTAPRTGFEPEFEEAIGRVAQRIGVTTNDLKHVMHFETGGTFDPAQRNAAGSGATGLIQFMPRTAEGLGTTTDALSKMTRAQQMDYVEKYLAPYAGKLKNRNDLYLSILNPQSIGSPPETVMKSGGTEWRKGTAFYKQNRGFDKDGKGYITVGDVTAKINNQREDPNDLPPLLLHVLGRGVEAVSNRLNPANNQAEIENRAAGRPRDLGEAAKDSLFSAIPLAGGVPAAIGAEELRAATSRIQDGAGTPEDLQVLKRYLADVERSTTMPAQIAEGVGHSVRLGLQALGGSVLGPLGSMAAMAADPADFQRRMTALQTAGIEIEADQDGTPTGRVILTPPTDESPESAALRTAALQGADALIETVGGKMLAKGANLVGRGVIKAGERLAPETTKAISNLATRVGDTAPMQVARRAEIQGIIPEYGEEVLQAAAGAALGEPGNDPMELLDPTSREAQITAAVTAILGGAPKLAGLAFSREGKPEGDPTLTPPPNADEEAETEAAPAGPEGPQGGGGRAETEEFVQGEDDALQAILDALTIAESQEPAIEAAKQAPTATAGRDLVRFAHSADHGTIEIGRMPENLSAITKHLGVEVPSDTPHMVDASAIRHVLNSHPELTDADIARIPDVVNNPTWIGATENSWGNKRIWFLKQDEGDLLSIAQYGRVRGQMRLRTFYKEEAGKILRDLKQKGVPLAEVANSPVISPSGGYPDSQSGLSVPGYTPTESVTPASIGVKGQFPSRIEEFPIERLTLSEDVPQFKEGADESGVVQGNQLGGKFQRDPLRPIVAWERIDGRVEVITGRHRFDLAKRSGEQTIPTQIYREADGFTEADALTMDAESNIQDEQGTIRDYAHYFRNKNISQEEAKAKGFLSRTKGRAGWSLARDASNDLYDVFRNGVLSEDRAVAIALAAPGNEQAQRAGIRAAAANPSASAMDLANTVRSVLAFGDIQSGEQTDLFGNIDDTSFIEEMTRRGKIATDNQRQIAERLRILNTAKIDPAKARSLGIDITISDRAAVDAEKQRLRHEAERWKDWPQYPDLAAIVRGEEAARGVQEEFTGATTEDNPDQGALFDRSQPGYTPAPPQPAGQPKAGAPYAPQQSTGYPELDATLDEYPDLPNLFRGRLYGEARGPSVVQEPEAERVTVSEALAYAHDPEVLEAAKAAQARGEAHLPEKYRKHAWYNPQTRSVHLTPTATGAEVLEEFLHGILEHDGTLTKGEMRALKAGVRDASGRNWSQLDASGRRGFTENVIRQAITRYMENGERKGMLNQALWKLGQFVKSLLDSLGIRALTPNDVFDRLFHGYGRARRTSSADVGADAGTRAGIRQVETPEPELEVTAVRGADGRLLKSATGNRGTYDSVNPDIRAAIRSTQTQSDQPARIQLPELTTLARDLMAGKYPGILRKIRAVKGVNPQGVFRPGSEEIDLRADLFIGHTLAEQPFRGKPSQTQLNTLRDQAIEQMNLAGQADKVVAKAQREGKKWVARVYLRDHDLAARTLAHEIGHLVDYLPDGDLTRGNLLGRIGTFKKYMASTMPDDPSNPEEAITKAEEAEWERMAAAEPVESWEEVVKVIKESVPGVTITPQDIKDIWNRLDGSGIPGLTEYVKALGDKERVRVAKEAMKGVVSDLIDSFQQPSTVERTVITRRPVTRKPTRAEVMERVQKRFTEEVKRRKLIEEKVVRKELQDLSKWWKPLPDDASAQFKRYRMSGVELYADWIGVLFNNPAEAAARAPVTYKAFMAYLGNKPIVKRLYEKIQSEIREGAIPANRLDEYRQMLRRGEDHQREAFEKRTAKERVSIAGLIDGLKRVFVSEAGILPEQARELAKRLDYMPATIVQMMRELQETVLDPLSKLGLSNEDLAVYLGLRRAATERQDMANPLGQRGDDAYSTIEELRRQIGDERFEGLKAAAEAFWELRNKYIIPRLLQSGMFPAELMEKIKNNKNYAKFTVQEFINEFLDGNGGAWIFPQVGTLKEIANPLTETLKKDISLLRAVYENEAKVAAIENTGATSAKMRWNGAQMVPVKPHDPRLKLMSVRRDGKEQHWYVPREVVDFFESDPARFGATFKALVYMSEPFRRLFVTNNPLFGFWNLQRDARALYQNLPGNPLTQPFSVVRAYMQTAHDAYLDAFLNKSTPFAEELYRADVLIAGRTWGAHERKDSKDDLERLMTRFEMGGTEHQTLWRRLGHWVFNDLNQFMERWSKFAGAKYLTNQGLQIADTRTRQLVRSRAGSPDFMERGLKTPLLNQVFMFSNANIQGTRASWQAVRENPIQYGIKMLLNSVLPKFLMGAAIHGLLDWMLGDDDETIKKMMERIPESDRRNYITIPLGTTEDGETAYFVMPQDFTGQVAGRITTITMENGADWTGIAGSIAGMAPYGVGQLAPPLELMIDIMQVATGQNPYDFFRSANKVSKTAWTAGGADMWKELGQAEWDGFFGSSIGRMGDIPLLGPAMRRFVRVSDRGLDDKLRREMEPATREEARISLRIGRFIDSEIEQYEDGLPSKLGLTRDAKAVYRRAKARGDVFDSGYSESAFVQRYTNAAVYRYGDAKRKALQGAGRLEKKVIEGLD